MSKNALLSHSHRKRRFRFYFVLFILGMIVSFYSGYQIGYENCKGHDGENSDLKISLKLKEIVNNPGGVRPNPKSSGAYYYKCKSKAKDYFFS